MDDGVRDGHLHRGGGTVAHAGMVGRRRLHDPSRPERRQPSDAAFDELPRDVLAETSPREVGSLPKDFSKIAKSNVESLRLAFEKLCADVRIHPWGWRRRRI